MTEAARFFELSFLSHLQNLHRMDSNTPVSCPSGTVLQLLMDVPSNISLRSLNGWRSGVALDHFETAKAGCSKNLQQKTCPVHRHYMTAQSPLFISSHRVQAERPRKKQWLFHAISPISFRLECFQNSKIQASSSNSCFARK